jgi:hypothetical protein
MKRLRNALSLMKMSSLPNRGCWGSAARAMRWDSLQHTLVSLPLIMGLPSIIHLLLDKKSTRKKSLIEILHHSNRLTRRKQLLKEEWAKTCCRLRWKMPSRILNLHHKWICLWPQITGIAWSIMTFREANSGIWPFSLSWSTSKTFPQLVRSWISTSSVKDRTSTSF